MSRKSTDPLPHGNDFVMGSIFDIEGRDTAPSLTVDWLVRPPLAARRKRGRKRTWLANEGEALRLDVLSIMKELKCNVITALRHLQKDKTKPWHKHPLSTLGARYRDACRRHRSETLRDTIASILTEQMASAEQASSRND
jgi:hypothetical protein